MLSRYCLWITIIFAVCQKDTNVNASSAQTVLRHRSSLLEKMAFIGVDEQAVCSKDNFVAFSPNFGYGNSGNNIIELIHGLWVAKHLNSTLVVPLWMHNNALAPFDTSVLEHTHCLTFDPVPANANVKHISAQETFYLFNWYRNGHYKALHLPDYNHDTVVEVSRLYLQVYAALWSRPQNHIVSSSLRVIEGRLGSDFSYVAVHKRLMEGYCQDQMSWQVPVKDLSPAEVALDSPEWAADLTLLHPLCQMTQDFAHRTMVLHGRANRTLFVAWDGQGNVADYAEHAAVFSTSLLGTAHDKVALKYVDMFLAIHSDFLLLNPLSTFSFQIHAVRLCLGMLRGRSVPLVLTKDLWMYPLSLSLSLPESSSSASPADITWVSPVSLAEAYRELMAVN